MIVYYVYVEIVIL